MLVCQKNRSTGKTITNTSIPCQDLSASLLLVDASSRLGEHGRFHLGERDDTCISVILLGMSPSQLHAVLKLLRHIRSMSDKTDKSEA